MKDKAFNDFVLQSGIVLGLVFGIVMLITYFMGVSVMVSWWVMLFNLALAVGAPIYYGVKWKQFNDGFLDFKGAFLTIFAVFAIASIISTLFSLVLNLVIDPGLADALFNEVLESTVGMLEKFGTPESEIDKAIADMEAEREAYGIWPALKGYGGGLIFGAIIALIGGAIIKKTPPPFEQN